MRIAVVQFPGSNCERETMLAVKRAGMQPVEFLWNQPKEQLAGFDGYIIVGGFSYEDRSRAGVIAALDPIMVEIKKQSESGKPVLGICNGAQILVETGLVPGIENNKVGLSLTDNKRVQQDKVLGTGYYNAWVNMRLSDKFQRNAFTRLLTTKDILHLPVAHGEGRFVIPPGLLAEMQLNGLNVFQYCDEAGKIIEEFPVNPNGSVNNIAAISNKSGNVMAMMPHPERTAACDAIFNSMREYIQEHAFQPVAPLQYYPRKNEIKRYAASTATHQLIIDLVITDNNAMSVENALHHQGLPVKIQRHIHWEIECDSDLDFEKIKTSGVLFNDRKEKLIKSVPKNSILIRAKEDMIGRQKLQLLKNHFDIQGVKAIRHSILWSIAASDEAVNTIINSPILYNPNAHDCYYY